MTIGVGVSTIEAELARMSSMAGGAEPITADEYRARMAKAVGLMTEQGVDALYLDTSANLFYFTGIKLRPSERLHGAILTRDGQIAYLSPAFEEPKTRTMLSVGDDIRVWEEHESPTELVIETIRSFGIETGVVAVDPATPFFTVDGLRKAGNRFDFTNAQAITAACRMVKSPVEIALLKQSNAIALEVHRSIARILYEGISTLEVRAFVESAYRKLGGYFQSGTGLFLFGDATAYPHGVPYTQYLKKGDMVLTDMGCELHGYRSDITRSYVYGDPTPRQREVWEVEQKAQAAVFDAAKLGVACEELDSTARRVLESRGFGPGYALPGLPHRTGHGIGVEVHEEAYIVRGSKQKLVPGMCFSNEPTIAIYGEFGIRLEDCMYMAEDGAHWFTNPALNVEDPFRYEMVAELS